MWDALKNAVGWVLDGIKVFFTAIFDFLISAVIKIFTTLWDGIIMFLKWVWDDLIKPVFEGIWATIGDLPFNDMVTKIDIGGPIDGSLVTNFVNVNWVVSVGVAATVFLMNLSLIKFAIKKIPGIS